MTLLVALPDEAPAAFDRGVTVRVGRARGSDVRVGQERVDGEYTVSRRQAELAWDGRRWTTTNTSDRSGLVRVYEPGYEEVALEPGATWAPIRSRWCCSVGRPDRPIDLLCSTDDHALAASGAGPEPDEEATAVLSIVDLLFTPLERTVIRAYYGEFAALPRPQTLEPRSHHAAALLHGRSSDSARKALERVNEKVARTATGPKAATGRNVSAEIGRWLARSGALDP